VQAGYACYAEHPPPQMRAQWGMAMLHVLELFKMLEHFPHCPVRQNLHQFCAGLFPHLRACLLFQQYCATSSDLRPGVITVGWLCRYYIIGGSVIRFLTGNVSVHIHHLYLGWALAMWSVFSHPISAMTLAVGMAVFVQGVSLPSGMPPRFIC
jgi:hypothetical protein